MFSIFNKGTKMNRESVFEQLKIDEGVVYEIYKDHLGYPTFGVGHLVLESDQSLVKTLEPQSQKNEQKNVLKKTLTPASQNALHYMEMISQIGLESYKKS